MRVLLNCFGFLKPTTIITERRLFSECQIALFVADICHFLVHKKISLRTVIVQRLILFNVIHTNVFIGNMQFYDVGVKTINKFDPIPIAP